jgi:uncharacterized protein (TIGR00299 family) protein
MRIGYLDCFAGISGDMMLGALVDAGAPFALLEETTAALNVGARLEMRKVTRGGISATKVDVIAPDSHHAGSNHAHESHATHEHGHSHHDSGSHSHSHSHGHTHEHHHDSGTHSHSHSQAHASHSEQTHTHSHAPHRSLSAILGIIRGAAISETVKTRAARAFQLLGEAEARIHSVPLESVHFHEVGAVDTIVDIVCSAAGAEALKIDRWFASNLNVGSGTVVCAHGTLPVPAPATLALLGDAPVYAAGPPMERITPTGAALLRMLDVRYALLPPMRAAATGYGAGGRDTPGEPNALRIVIGEEQIGQERVANEPGTEPIAVIETVIDDCSPQLLAYASEQLLAAGAWDVVRAPVQMKKGRTGAQITVLCHPDKVAQMRDILFRETSTIGLRWRLEHKASLQRDFALVETEWGKVRIKVARWPSGEAANAQPEYEDCRAIAAQRSVPLKHVMQEAMRVYWNEHDRASVGLRNQKGKP